MSQFFTCKSKILCELATWMLHKHQILFLRITNWGTPKQLSFMSGNSTLLKKQKCWALSNVNGDKHSDYKQFVS